MNLTHALRLPVPPNLRCASCGYSLRGLKRNGRCPECGYAIIASMDETGAGDSAWDVRTALAYCITVAGTLVVAAGAAWLPLPIPLGYVALATLTLSLIGFALLMISAWWKYPLVWLAWVAAAGATYASMQVW